jgi:hypothetical protein
VRTSEARLDTRKPWYFLLTLAVFWLPLIPLSRLTWHRLHPPEKRAFWATCFLVGFLTFLMEFVYRRTAKIWTFSQQKDRLVGLHIFGEPIEEFSFWLGATPFMVLVYLSRRLFGRRKAYENRRAPHYAHR